MSEARNKEFSDEAIAEGEADPIGGYGKTEAMALYRAPYKAPSPGANLTPIGAETLIDFNDLAFIIAAPSASGDSHPGVTVGWKGGLVQVFTGDVATAVRQLADARRASHAAQEAHEGQQAGVRLQKFIADSASKREADRKATADAASKEAPLATAEVGVNDSKNPIGNSGHDQHPSREDMGAQSNWGGSPAGSQTV